MVTAKEGLSSTQRVRHTSACVLGTGDIGTVEKVQTSKMCFALCEFLESYAVRTIRVIVSNTDAERAWKACSERTGDLRMILGELADARRGRGAVASRSFETDAYEKDFINRFGLALRKHVAFECCMFQTAEEDEEGRVKWRDLTCQDADDFHEFLKFTTLISDVVSADKLALVPSGENMLWQNSIDMCAVAMGENMAEKKIGEVVRVEGLVEIEDGTGLAWLVAHLSMEGVSEILQEVQ